MKILLLTCGTGEGHNSAAFAMQEHLKRFSIESQIFYHISFKSDKAEKRSSGIYNWVIKHTPFLFGRLYQIGRLYDFLKLPSPVYRANAKYSDRLYTYITENSFDAVICTHLFAMEAMTAVKAKHKEIKAYGVMTDYTMLPFFKDTRLDGYFCANEFVENQLIKKGIPNENIYITGIPVKPCFSQRLSKSEAKRLLSLGENEKVITVLSGGVGCGNQVKLCKTLLKEFPNYKIFLLCGKNESLKAKADSAFNGNPNIKALCFTDDMHIYMKACDILFSKPGGLTSTEAAVANSPLVHLKAIPGCETYNIKNFVENKMSLCGSTHKKAIAAARLLANDEALQNELMQNQRALIPANAAERIIETVTKNIF